MPEICLVVLIGLPAAGKTTFCKELNRKLSSSAEFQCHTVTYDSITAEKGYESAKNDNTSLHTKYKELRDRAFIIAEETLKSVGSSQNNLKRSLILIDDNMYYKSMRYKYYKLAKKYDTSFLQIYFDVVLDTAINRNRLRTEDQVPESIIRDMATKLEVPGKERWELNSLTFDSNSDLRETSLAILLERITKCMKLPIHSPVQEKTGTLPVTKQQSIDLLLRKITHTKINENKNDAESYVKKKKEIFQNIKHGIIVVDKDWSETEICNYLENLF